MANKNYRAPQRSTSIPPKRSRRWLWLLALPVAAILVLAVLELTNTTYIFHKRKAVSGTIPSTTHSDGSQQSSGSNSNPSQQPSTTTTGSSTQPDNTKTNTPTNTSDAALAAPYGNFVSNHHPGAGNNAPTQESSVCLTTPGASCTITFTNSDGVVKSLSAKIADSSGTAYWDQWDVKTAGFTDGTWQIKATATLNGKSLSTTSDQPLDVKL